MSTAPRPTGPARPRTGKPIALTFSGVVLLVAAVTLTVLGAANFFAALPLGVLAADGRAGPDAVGSTATPGTIDLELEAGTHYAIWLLAPVGTTASLDGLPTVRGPAGTDTRVSPLAQVTGEMTRGGTSARTVAGFRAAESGSHTLTVPTSSNPGTTVLITEEPPFGAFMAGLFGTVTGVLAGVFLGFTGLLMAVGGAIWWHLRRQSPATAAD